MNLPRYEFVTIEQDEHGSITILKYNRPKSGNSLHPRMVAEMLSALRWADSQPEIRIIIQTGEGKFFCTGMELLNTEAHMSFALGSDFHQLNKTLISSEKILIAAVNGPAAGYGVSSLALFDLVYSVPDAYFFTPFVKWGMATEGGSSFTFPRLMGHQKAAVLCLAGEQIPAEEAERLNLVTKVLPRDNFWNEVSKVARRLAHMPQGALRTTKKLMKAPVLEALHEANDRECTTIDKERFGSKEYTEAIQQFRIDQERKCSSKSKL